MDASDGESSPALTLTTEDLAQIRTFGRALNTRVSYVVGEWALYTIYLVLCTTAMVSIFKSARQSCRMRLLFATLFLTCVLVTTMCCSDLAALHQKITQGLVDDGIWDVSERFDLIHDTLPVQISYAVRTLAAGSADMGILFHIADLLAAWRAVVIWNAQSRTLLAVTLYFLIFCSFALYVPYAVFVYARMSSPDQQIVSNSDTLAILAITSSLFSILANIIATTMIGTTAYRQARLETSSRIRLSSSRILSHITESGLLYALLQIARLALTASVVPSTPKYQSLHTAQATFQRAGAIITAMYPPALILIVNHGCSVADTFGTHPASNGTPSQTISLDMSFARQNSSEGVDVVDLEDPGTPSTGRDQGEVVEKVRERRGVR